MTFIEKEAGERAIAEMQGHEIKGQAIVVKHATPRDAKGGKGSCGGEEKSAEAPVFSEHSTQGQLPLTACDFLQPTQILHRPGWSEA